MLSGEFNLSGVQSAAQLQSRAWDLLGDLAGASDRPGWAVEGRQEAVAGGIHLPAAEVVQFPGIASINRLAASESHSAARDTRT